MRPEDGNELATAVEAEFGVAVPEGELVQVRTAGDLHRLLMRTLEEQPAATSDSGELWDRLQKLLRRKLENPVQEIDENTVIEAVKV